MNKKMVGISLLVLLVLGAGIVTAVLKSNNSSPVNKECSCGCGGTCDGNCGVEGCSCSGKAVCGSESCNGQCGGSCGISGCGCAK